MKFYVGDPGGHLVYQRGIQTSMICSFLRMVHRSFGSRTDRTLEPIGPLMCLTDCYGRSSSAPFGQQSLPTFSPRNPKREPKTIANLGTATMGHLLLAPRGGDVFNPAASSSFNLHHFSLSKAQFHSFISLCACTFLLSLYTLTCFSSSTLPVATYIRSACSSSQAGQNTSLGNTFV